MMTGLNSRTFEHLQLGAGLFIKDFNPDAASTAAELKALLAQRIESGEGLLGATRGGGSFQCKPALRHIEADGLRIAHLGDLGHMPDEALLAAIRDVDVNLIPIGGFFTIDTAQAVEVIRQANPRAAVAMHFRNAHCGFTISDETEFIRLTGAVETPSELEITPETALHKAIVMRYE